MPPNRPVEDAVDVLGNPRRVYVSFGDAPKLVSDEYILEQLAPLGLTAVGLRKLFRRIGVPVIYMGKHRLVDINAFQIALCAISRLGQPDFWMPGAEARNEKGRPPCCTELDPAKFRAEWKEIYAHFIASKVGSGVYKPAELGVLAHKAAQRLMDLGFPDQLRLASEQLQKEALSQAVREHPNLHAPPNAQPLP